MTAEYFQVHMNRLANAFGQQYYKQERTEIIWKAIRSLPDKMFSSIVDQLIASERQAPLLPQILDAIDKQRQGGYDPAKDRKKTYWERDTYECSKCRDCGVLVAMNLNDKQIYGFRCDCESGQLDTRKALPMWGEKWVADYDLSVIDRIKKNQTEAMPT